MAAANEVFLHAGHAFEKHIVFFDRDGSGVRKLRAQRGNGIFRIPYSQLIGKEIAQFLGACAICHRAARKHAGSLRQLLGAACDNFCRVRPRVVCEHAEHA